MLSKEASEIKEQILDAQTDFQGVHDFLSAAKMNNVTVGEYNKTNQTNYSEEDFRAAVEDLEDDVEIGWKQRMEDVASYQYLEEGDPISVRATFDNDRESPFYEKYLRDVSLAQIEEYSNLALEDAREEIEANGTLF